MGPLVNIKVYMPILLGKENEIAELGVESINF